MKQIRHVVSGVPTWAVCRDRHALSDRVAPWRPPNGAPSAGPAPACHGDHDVTVGGPRSGHHGPPW